MYTQFGALRPGRGDGLGSDSEAEGRQDSGWGRNIMYNRGSVEADSDIGTPQPQLGPMATTTSQWTGNPSSSTAQVTQWQPAPEALQSFHQVDPIPVVDRPLQPPKPKRTRVKGGRKNANANPAGDSASQTAVNGSQPIAQPSLLPATPQAHTTHRRKPNDSDSSETQSMYPALSMPAASGSSYQKTYPPGLSRTQSSERETRPQVSSQDSRHPVSIDYSLLNEEEGPETQSDFSYAPSTPFHPPATTSVSRKRPSPPPLDTTQFMSGHRDSMNGSAPPAPAKPSRAQEMPPPASPIRTKVKRRLLTLLIEDKRVDGQELAEIRVPLQQRGDNLWVEAAPVVESLQSGPSRIDGPCKVHAMRGHFRQRFLRIEHDGREVYDDQQSLQVLEDARGKILNVFVEPIPLPLASTPAYRGTSHASGALHLNLNETSHLPLTPRSTGPSPLPSQQSTQHKRKRLASTRDASAAPDNTLLDYNNDYEQYDEPAQQFEQTPQLYESSLPSSSRKRTKPNAQLSEVTLSPRMASPAGNHSGPSKPGQASSELRMAKATHLNPGRSSSRQASSAENAHKAAEVGAPSSRQPVAQHHPPPSTPAYRQSSFDLDAPPTISTSARAAKSNGNSLGIGLPSARLPAVRTGRAPMASSIQAPAPEVVDISSRESSPERGSGAAPSPLFSQASPPAVDAHAPPSASFSPAPFEPLFDDNPPPSPAPPPAESEPAPEPLAPPSPPPLDPAIAKLLPLDIPPTTYVASEMPELADQIEQAMAARLTNTLRMDGFGFKDFQEKLTAGQGLSNERALHWYRWVHEKVQKYANGTARAPAECERRLIEPKHVLAALQVTEAWYEIVRETLSMMLAYGPGGQRGANPRVVQAASDQKRGDARLGVVRWTQLLLLLREVHDEWSKAQNTPRT